MNNRYMFVLLALMAGLLAGTKGSAHGMEQERPRRSVIQYKNMIECATGRSGWRYEGYGCWCAFNGKGKPVDKCCKEHDDCYKKIKESKICEWPHDYSVYYLEYKKTKDCLTCAVESEYKDEKEAQCKIRLCECDVIGAKCLKRSKYNKTFAFHDRNKC